MTNKPDEFLDHIRLQAELARTFGTTTDELLDEISKIVTAVESVCNETSPRIAILGLAIANLYMTARSSRETANMTLLQQANDMNALVYTILGQTFETIKTRANHARKQ